MRTLFVTVRMKPEYRDQILKGAFEDGRGSREDEPGCLRFDVIQDERTRTRSTFTRLPGRCRARSTPRGAPLPRLGQPASRLVRRPEGGRYPRHDDRALGGRVPLDWSTSR